MGELRVQPGSENVDRVAVAYLLDRLRNALRLDGDGIEIGVEILPVLFGNEVGDKFDPRMISIDATDGLADTQSNT